MIWSIGWFLDFPIIGWFLAWKVGQGIKVGVGEDAIMGFGTYVFINPNLVY